MNFSMLKDETVTDELRTLYERSGFTKVFVNQFEEYNLYVDNRNFFKLGGAITFTDKNGVLMSLKPDVTLSIIKNVPKQRLAYLEKFYYVDRVCRSQKDSTDYKMLGQIGVELIGPHDRFTNVETVFLALESLRRISGDFILDISHLGIVSGLLDRLEARSSVREKLIRALHSKSTHEIGAILRDYSVDSAAEKAAPGDPSALIALAGISGGYDEGLKRVEPLIAGDEMRAAYDELVSVKRMLDDCGYTQHVILDFSVLNDLDYYNGLIFNGYVKGVPTAVLTGGRYDNLMKSMGKDNRAIGFAVSLSELNKYFKQEREYDFDAHISYTDGADYARLLNTMKAMNAEGKSVFLENAASNRRAGKLCAEYYTFDENGLIREAAGEGSRDA